MPTAKDKSAARLRRAVRTEVKSNGLVKTARRIGITGGALSHFLAGTGTSHRGTIALIEQAFQR